MSPICPECGSHDVNIDDNGVGHCLDCNKYAYEEVFILHQPGGLAHYYQDEDEDGNLY